MAIFKKGDSVTVINLIEEHEYLNGRTAIVVSYGYMSEEFNSLVYNILIEDYPNPVRIEASCIQHKPYDGNELSNWEELSHVWIPELIRQRAQIKNEERDGDSLET